MSAITATGITWNTTGTAWASSIAGTVLSGKAIATGMLVTGAVTAAVMMSPMPAPGGDVSITSAPIFDEVTQEIIAGQEDFVVVGETVDKVNKVVVNSASSTPEILLASVMQDASAEDPAVVEIVDPNAEVPSLEGDWRIFGGEDAQELQLLGIAQLDREGSTLSISSKGALESLISEGTIRGTQVSITLRQQVSEVETAQLGTLEGSFSEDYRVLAVSGTIGLPDGSGDVREISIRLEKMTESEQSRQETLELARERIRAVQGAIANYTVSNGVTPMKLEMLYPDYLIDEELIEESEIENLQYTPTPSEWFETIRGISPTSMDSWTNFMATGNPGFLIDLEEDLDALWGDHFPGGIVWLRLENHEHKFAMESGDGGSIKDVLYTGNRSVADTRTDSEKAAQRAACANNLKQLGLSFKMFENETKGEYFPGGFRQIYPEYLSDLAILSCPSGLIGESSYFVIFPATNRDDWRTIYANANGLTLDELPRSVQAAVPIMADIDECSGSGGRNVLFVDGHVEYMLHADYDAMMDVYSGVRY